MGQIVLTQLDCRIFQSTISPEQVNEIDWSFACSVHTNLKLIKSLWVGLVVGLLNWLYLKNEPMELTNFFDAGANSRKLKVVSVIFGWAWSKMGLAI